jgi:ribosomal protein S17E
MATSQELFEQIKDFFTEFEENHNASTKVGKSKARKAIGEIKKLVTDYRKASVEESK